MQHKTVSLFSGGMGLDLGLEAAGFQTVACVENDSAAAATIKHNKQSLALFDTSITEVSGSDIRAKAGLDENEEIDLVSGGPPCQSFSVFGNRLGIKDARGQLIFEFIRIVDELRPKAFLLENVRGLLSMSLIPKKKSGEIDETVDPSFYKKGSLIKKIFEGFNDIGYQVDCFVVNSANYGAPQIRERVLLIGNRFNAECNFPKPTHSNRPKDNLPPFKTLGEAIGPDSGFVDPCSEVLNFSPRKLKYLSMVPAGGNWRSLPVDIQKESMGKSWYLKGGRSAYWRKLSFEFPSPTVVTMPNHAGTSMCHPTELRAITVGEAAAIQEFPHDWVFSGSTSEKFKQIGNAVPVRLGKVAGKAILQMLDEINSVDTERMNGTLRKAEIIHIRPHIRTRTFWKNGQAFAGDHCYYETKNDAANEKQLKIPFSSNGTNSNR